MKRLKIPVFGIALFAGLLCLSPSPVFAHASGASKVNIHLLPNDSITVEVDVNSDDIVNATRSDLVGGIDREKALLFQSRLTQYLLSRMQIKADNRQVEDLQVVRWKPDGKGPQDDFQNDGEAFFAVTTRVITFGGRLPPHASVLSVGTQFFLELGSQMQPISEVSVYWKDHLVTRRWIEAEHTLRVPITPKDLQASLDRSKSVEEAPDENLIVRFLKLGYTHILPHGLDHILFVLGLFFFSTRMRPLFMQITAFTIAHSITLGIAMVGIFRLPGTVVEPLIALSIAVVGLENVFFRKVKASRWLLVFAFGLIHGMGFAGVLSQFGLPEGRFWSTLLSFNLGVEFGQITVVAAAFALTFWMRKKSWYFKGVVVPVSLAISAVGLFWAVQRAFGF